MVPSLSIGASFLSASFIEQEKENIRNIYLPNTKTWVWEDSGAVVGFISLIENEVGAIFLLPAFHGKGIGKQMMDIAASKHTELIVDVFEENQIGRAFYQKYGFKHLKTYFHEDSGHSMMKLRFSS